MLRSNNTDQNGYPFQERVKRMVWEKAQTISGRDPNEFRVDVCGALMRWSQYGVTVKNGTGWEIDHIKPVARGGDDSIQNLQALHWENNRYKGDMYPQTNYCVRR